MQAILLEPKAAQLPCNILPQDGDAQYFPGVIDSNDADILLKALLEKLDWQADQLVMFGQPVTTKRKVAWVGEEHCTYTYSGQKKLPQPWIPELLVIKKIMEELSHWKFNSCLLNLYHDGSEGMGWHSDNEKELHAAAPIASLSLGEIRKFAFKHKVDKTNVSLFLEKGSVLIMRAPTQHYWKHSLLKTSLPAGMRINLTFRDIG